MKKLIVFLIVSFASFNISAQDKPQTGEKDQSKVKTDEKSDEKLKADGTEAETTKTEVSKDASSIDQPPATPVKPVRPVPLAVKRPKDKEKKESDDKKTKEIDKVAKETHKKDTKIRVEARVSHHKVYNPRKGISIGKKGWRLELGGFVRLDAIYNTEGVFMLDSPGFAYPEDQSRGGNLSFSARATRLRANFMAPRLGNWKPSALYEIDFYGNLPESSTSIRQSQLRMRLAYLELKNSGLTLRAGNDWMVAAPNFSATMEIFNLWGQGNIWMRYPQIKADYKHSFNRHLRLEAAASAGNSMGGDGPKTAQVNDGGIGEFSKFPVFQARLGAGFKLPGSEWSSIGVSGSWQRLDLTAHDDVHNNEEAITNLENADSAQLDSYFFAVDAKLNYSINKVKIQGTFEYHMGQAIGMYWGGIIQTFDFVRESGVITDANPIKSIGYFADLKVLFPCGFGFMGGYGINNVDEDDLTTSNRSSNRIIYGGLTYKLGPVIFGLGASRLDTEYTVGSDGKNMTFHGFTTIKF
ncbi:MAG: hypothetical protein PF689_08050 [Deltaproteobacteria bacterium]|jgi:hypothetical protein|nr:hypothetical protein [Deltaproteobacteria bacterium]